MATFKFLDKERDIKFSFADVLKIQKMPDVDASDPQAGVNRTLEILVMGLRRGDPGITADSVADLVDMETFPQLIETVNAAIGRTKIETPDPTVGV